ncbi:branched-chain amino acid transport system II carrier protein [Priestia koreensis]|uniref:branched-chain amino acid transport system II carrier protein n=1 Tax=Priestia koreensis TaxID=284581 RepID=UPI001F58B262|nr:branched-chain amino acid transport system II carrier protein [Priestia koreensis]UNL86627.1 branched-chain amino acid transport system II carrier protein [Priestia koreensis]
MTTLSRKETFFVGLMLFALFFGAGNLIFPPFLGQQSGAHFWYAIAGFIITGVGLPILTVLAVAKAKNGIQTIGNRVHPVFGVVFTVIVYLAIGPFMGIPRGANVAYEMSVKPFVSEGSNTMALLIFTVIFFGLVYWVSLNPSKLVDRIGSLLTPALLIAIAVLGVGSLLKLKQPLGAVSNKYQSHPVIHGFMEGYLTMDTIAALAFGIVVITAIRQKGVTNQRAIVKGTLQSGLIAGVGLILVYVTIGVMGAKAGATHTYKDGAAILTTTADQLFSVWGVLLLGVIVLLACFTTCVGLVVACSQYFGKLLPMASHMMLVTVMTVISFLIANLGLADILSLSVPVLSMIYPLTIVLVILSFFHGLFKESARGIYSGALIGTILVSVYDGLVQYGVKSEFLTDLYGHLPLFAEGLGWLIPAIIGGLCGFLVSLLSKRADQSVHA